MSKINAFRLININYNHNTIRISDECFHLNGESTLLSLRNGGGKSVLVQMLTAPFVHKRYRDTKDRPFASYFTGSRPSFILVEWALDQGAGYVMTGIMVRKNQDTGEESGEELEIISLISEYQKPCIQDLHHLPVVERGKKEMTLKNFSACRQLFESYKRDRSMRFFYYDLNQAAQSRQYFDRLSEYRISYREWENIIKRVNLKESGLSELFSDCKDVKGLTEKWFLYAVENKLNKEKSRVKEFQEIVGKYVGLYKDNQLKIKRRDTIRLFKEEAAGVKERALACQRAEEAAASQENRIACFIRELEGLRERGQDAICKVQRELEELRDQISRVEYEKLSSEIHGLQDEKRFHMGNRDMFEMEREALEREAAGIRQSLWLLACARQQETVDNEQWEWESAVRRLEVFCRRDADLEPERMALGYGLRQYYGQELGKEQELLEENRKRRREKQEQIRTCQEKLFGLREKGLETAARQGALKSRVEAYDASEEEFNSRYGESLIRNLLGEYEPGLLEIRGEEYEKEREKTARERLNQKKKLEASRELARRLERDLEDQREKKLQIGASLRENEKTEKMYEAELEERWVILKYLNLEEKHLFDREWILNASERKLQEIEALLRNLEKEQDELQRELRRLTDGELLELPEDVKKAFLDAGIHLVHGMEWLKKNGYSEEQNRELVQKNPFLPYCLILTRKELLRLSTGEGGVCTSFPIPIMEREQLEQEREKQKGPVVLLPGVGFYVLFNETLLNEEKLCLLVEEKRRQAERRKEAIAIRKKEQREYLERQEKLRLQSVSRDNYEKMKREKELLAGELARAGELVETLRSDLAEERSGMERLEGKIRSCDQSLERQKRRQEDFERLCSAFKRYAENRNALEACRKEMEGLKEQQKLSGEQLERMQEQVKTLEADYHEAVRESERLEARLRRYQSYERPVDFEHPADRAEDVWDPDVLREREARFEAITASFSMERRELEQQAQKSLERFQRAVKELERLQTKYNLAAEAWKGIRCSREEETHQETLLKEKERRIEEKRLLWNQEDKKTAVLENRIQDRQSRMKRECGQEQPLPREEIKSQDFDGRKSRLAYQEQEKRNEKDALSERLRHFDENLTALAEYSGLLVREEISWETDLAELSGRALRDFKGALIRDYNQNLRERQEGRERLTFFLNRMARKEAFQDEFYQKPLESMLALTGEAGMALEQLHTTTASYDSLMEKLEVDISLVEKERDRLTELLEEYVREVHRNMGKIDGNSTISVRDHAIKMLKIQLPAWEENEELYHMRLQDLLDEITQKGIALFEKGENAQEYFGTRITTRNLYDTTIGIGNVQIQLFKIEEHREYPITWAEVSRNSGGEGFLSAFVILSCLLDYMRKDDTDIFAERNEGKVLVMDNPFAQTNASHLLKPLMDMAKKTNTQLICLTGLGGESIYNRFDNIYVLNLITASLRNGMQYLRADHLQGSEPESLVTSRIEVSEQEEMVLF